MKTFRTFIVALLFFLGPGVLGASEANKRLLRGLADRNLFESVEFFCAAELNKAELPVAEQYALAAEWLRSRSRQMLQVEPHRRAALLESLGELEHRYLTGADDPSKPGETLARLTLLFQRAIADATLGEWQCREANIGVEADRDRLLQDGRKTLLDAVDRFKLCDARLNELRQRQGVNRDQTFDRDWLGLLRSVQFQWGLAQQSLALSFPPGSADREFGLNAAVQILDEPARVKINEDAIYRCKIELASCFRLLGRLDACARLLQELQKTDLSTELRFQAETERLRFLLAAGQLELARKDYQTGRAGSECYPEFDLARLELFLAEGRQLRKDAQGKLAGADKELQEALLAEILKLARRIEERSGPFWGRRARMLLTEASLSETEGVDGSVLMLLGLDQYQSGRFSESVRLFERATDRAIEAGSADSALGGALYSAGVLNEVLVRLETGTDAGKAGETGPLRQRMIDGLLKVARRFPRDPQAPEVFLKAVDFASESVLKKERTVTELVKLHTEFAEIWPDSPKTPAVRLRAAELLATQNDTLGVLAILEKIPNATEAGPRAVELARQTFEASQNSTGPRLSEAETATWFASRLPQDPVAVWMEADATSGIAAAEYGIRAFAANPAQATEALKQTERILRDVLARCPSLSPGHRAQAQALLVTALTGQGRQQEGGEIMKNLNENQVATLSPAEKRAFQRTQVLLLADTDRLDAAVKLARELLKESPKDRSLHEMLAEILTRSNKEADLTEAIQLWTKIAAGTEKNTEPWWQARERIFEIYVKQGKTTEAKRNFERLRILYPDLGGPARKSRLGKMLNETGL